VEHLDRLVAAVDGLLARSGSQLSPLDLRLVSEDASLHHGLDERNRAWTDGVMAAIVAGSALDQAMPETIDASTPRRALHALLDCLRYEVDLDQLRDAWPGIREDLRCHVLGLVREDAAEKLEALGRALQACGIRPLDQPEPTAAAAALRTLLRELLATRETDRTRFELRTAFLKAHARGATPRLGRYLLARELSERGAVVVDGSRSLASAEARALLEEPRPDRRPALPTSLVGPALICLATLDVIESRAVPDRPWRGRSAYNVLRVVSDETRWPADLRAMMESVLNGAVPSDDALLSLATHATAQQEDGPPVRTPVPQGVSSPDPAGKAPANLAPDGRVATPSMGGDGTETSGARFVAGPPEVSSPATAGGPASSAAPVRDASRGGDGTETSKAQFHAGLSEVSSPGPPAARATSAHDDGTGRAERPAPGDETPAAASAGSPPLLVRTGEVWSVTWGTKTYPLVHRLGLDALQVLLSRPATPVSCTDLVQGRLVEDSPAQEVADKETLAHIYRELKDLDGLHSEGAEEQRARLREEVRRLLTPTGRLRSIDRERRKVQQAVYKRIRDAVRAIADVYPALGAHLRACVTTGAQCCYDPARARRDPG
jgi:hypothetical protein